MSGILQPDKINTEGYHAWRDQLVPQLEEISANPRLPYGSGFAVATLTTMSDPIEDEALRQLYLSNPERTAPEALRMLRACRGFVLAKRSGIAYPHEYTTDGDWFRGFSLMRQPRFRELYLRCLTSRSLGTSVSQRYAEAKFLDKVLEHHIGSMPVRCDVGCGDNSGNRRVILSDYGERFRFDPIKVMVGKSLGALVFSPEKSQILNSIIAGHDVTSRIVGIDKEDLEDEETELWRWVCLTPEEQVNGRLVELHDALMHAPIDASRLGFRRADVTRKADICRVKEAQGGQFDVVSNVASYYLGTSAERRVKFANTIGPSGLLKPGSIAYYIDFVRRENGSHSRLVTLRDWREMNVYIWMQGRLTRVMAATNGRWQSVRIFKALTEFADGGPYQDEVRALAA